MVNVDLYGAIITKVSNALNTLVSGEKPGFQTLSKGLVVLLCSEVVTGTHEWIQVVCLRGNGWQRGQRVLMFVVVRRCRLKT